jgi:hypothetical protein
LRKSGAGSVTRDLDGLRAADDAATSRIARRYWDRLRRLVGPRVRWYGRPAVSGDEDDVANAALNSGIQRLRDGNYPGVVEREGLWRYLAFVAGRKAARLVARWKGHPDVRPIPTLSDVVRTSASPSARAASAEDWRRLIEALDAYKPPKLGQHPTGEDLVRLARLLAEGYDIPEIADRFDVARCTVYRWWKLVKKIGAGLGIGIQDGDSAPLESPGS